MDSRQETSSAQCLRRVHTSSYQHSGQSSSENICCITHGKNLVVTNILTTAEMPTPQNDKDLSIRVRLNIALNTLGHFTFWISLSLSVRFAES